MSARRRPAFDPSRLDDIDELLPPAPPPTNAAAASPHPAEEEPVRPSAAVSPVAGSSGTGVPTSGERRDPGGSSTPSRKARGQGGRPRGLADTTEEPRSGPIPVAVRVPREVYDRVNAELLAGPERPSYGQIVLWTVEDHPDEVVSAVIAARPAPGSRRPRGRRLAADTVPVTLRMTLAERGLIDDVADAVREQHPGVVTRTEVATAALRCALYSPPSM